MLSQQDKSLRTAFPLARASCSSWSLCGTTRPRSVPSSSSPCIALPLAAFLHGIERQKSKNFVVPSHTPVAGSGKTRTLRAPKLQCLVSLGQHPTPTLTASGPASLSKNRVQQPCYSRQCISLPKSLRLPGLKALCRRSLTVRLEDGRIFI